MELPLARELHSYSGSFGVFQKKHPQGTIGNIAIRVALKVYKTSLTPHDGTINHTAIGVSFGVYITYIYIYYTHIIKSPTPVGQLTKPKS
jgi:hypothetical protein